MYAHAEMLKEIYAALVRIANHRGPVRATTMSTTTTSTSFVGWHRPGPGTPWQRRCSAPTADACLALLLDSIRGGDKVVLPEGTEPKQTRGSKGKQSLAQGPHLDLTRREAQP
jgi:hypothetical protein